MAAAGTAASWRRSTPSPQAERRPAPHAGPATAAAGRVARRSPRGWQNLENEPDTDFALPQNGEWAQQIVAKWKPLCGDKAPQIPAGRRGRGRCWKGGRAAIASIPRGRASSWAAIGRRARRTWRAPWSAPPPTRTAGGAAGCARGSTCWARWRRSCARRAADLMGAALANGGKTLPESDPEVSEAVDFLEFYRDTARWWQEMPTLKARGKGVVVVVSPWNFPIAIPCGGVAAALAAGNTVILKPASDTVLVAWELCQCFWRAGVSKKALQFVPCSGGTGRARAGRTIPRSTP